jgi:signal transduction histidine kinase
MLAAPCTRPLLRIHPKFSRFRGAPARTKLLSLTLPSLGQLSDNLNQQLKARIKQLSSAIAGAISVAIGVLALTGWAFQITLLKSFGLSSIAMNPVTAFVVILAGGALVLLSDRRANRQRKLWGRVLAGIAAAVGVLRLLCIWYGCGCGNVLDRWVFGCPFQHGFTHTESIDIKTALNMLLAGSALLLLDVQTRRGHRPAEALSAASGTIALLGLVAYSYNLIAYYTTPTWLPTALPSVMAFLFLATGTLLARSDRGTMCFVMSDTAGGLLARRLIPLAILLPILLGALRFLSENVGLHGFQFGAAHTAITSMVLFFAATWWTARLLYRADEERKTAELERDRNATHIHVLNAELEQRVAARTAELYQLNDELRRASKAKDDFLAMLSHELRTPLTPALAAATYLAEDESLAPTFREELASIQRSVQLEARLIDDLLDLTRITRGKIELHAEDVDAHALLRRTLRIVDNDLRHKHLNVIVRCEAERYHVSADPVRLQQVFWNLLNNAVKFTDRSGSIEINSANRDGALLIRISDTGIGIDQARQARIFDAFEQGERTTLRQFGGLGLGLAISKNLVELHGGTISVRSDGSGKGATFTIALPCIELTAIDPTDQLKPTARPSVDLRVLLVEDHADTLRVLSSILTKDGFCVRTAASVADARKLLDCESFDVLITDIGLPDGSGYQLMHAARQSQSLRGIAISGFGMEEDVQRSMEAGFEHHLIKPIDAQQLEALLTAQKN